MGCYIDPYDFCKTLLWNSIWRSSWKINSSAKEKVSWVRRQEKEKFVIKKDWHISKISKIKTNKIITKKRHELLSFRNTTKIVKQEKLTGMDIR